MFHSTHAPAPLIKWERRLSVPVCPLPATVGHRVRSLPSAACRLPHYSLSFNKFASGERSSECRFHANPPNCCCIRLAAFIVHWFVLRWLLHVTAVVRAALLVTSFLPHFVNYPCLTLRSFSAITSTVYVLFLDVHIGRVSVSVSLSGSCRTKFIH